MQLVYVSSRAKWVSKRIASIRGNTQTSRLTARIWKRQKKGMAHFEKHKFRCKEKMKWAKFIWHTSGLIKKEAANAEIAWQSKGWIVSILGLKLFERSRPECFTKGVCLHPSLQTDRRHLDHLRHTQQQDYLEICPVPADTQVPRGFGGHGSVLAGGSAQKPMFVSSD